MQKKPLSHAQMAVAIGASLLLAGPSFYLAAFQDSPWLAIALAVGTKGWLFWKRHSDTNQ
jgi:hypothetical protein